MPRGTKNRNAYAGHNVEVLFVNSIGDHANIIDKIKVKFNINSRFLNAINTGIQDEKVDVKMEFANGRNIDANIKAYKDIGFNQMTRTSIDKFCDKFEFDNDFREKLKRLTINKSKHTAEKWIPDSEKEYFTGLLQPEIKNIIKWSLSSQASREILVLYDRNASIMHIYSMKDVFRSLNYNIAYTVRGNISVGSFILLQRKGGNGVHSKDIAHDSLRHPGNNLQLKLKILPFVEAMSGIELCNYSI
jgi:hypothetical protein